MDNLINLKKKDFVQVENCVARNFKISFLAKTLYAVLLSYAINKRNVFPSQERLGLQLGVSKQYIRQGLKELEKFELIKVERVGLGKNNNYYLYDVPVKMKDEYYRNEISISAIVSEQREIRATLTGEERERELERIDQRIAKFKKDTKIEKAKFL